MLRKWRQTILQAFQIAGENNANHVGPCGKELAEFHIARSKSRQRARQTFTGAIPAPFDQACQTQGKLCLRRQWRGIDKSEHTLARKNKCRARQTNNMREC